MTTGRPIQRAREMAGEMAAALAALRCVGHVIAVPGAEEPTLTVARRFMVMELWVPWRVPHVMLVACVAAGERPAVVVGTWDPRGVVLQQTVTSVGDFAAEVARAAAHPVSEGDLAEQRAELGAATEVPDLENDEFWPEVLAKVLAEGAEGEAGVGEREGVDRGRDGDADRDAGVAGVAGAVVERIWPERLADLRERRRALED